MEEKGLLVGQGQDGKERLQSDLRAPRTVLSKLFKRVVCGRIEEVADNPLRRLFTADKEYFAVQATEEHTAQQKRSWSTRSTGEHEDQY